MIEQTIELIAILSDKQEREKEETILLNDACRFMQTFYRLQEQKIREKLDDIGSDTERSTSTTS